MTNGLHNGLICLFHCKTRNVTTAHTYITMMMLNKHSSSMCCDHLLAMTLSNFSSMFVKND